MPLKEVLFHVLISPYVIGAAIFMIGYGCIVSAVANKTWVRPPSLPRKQPKIKKPAREKPALAKNEDTSELALQ
jgi:hypothetical protein